LFVRLVSTFCNAKGRDIYLRLLKQSNAMMFVEHQATDALLGNLKLEIALNEFAKNSQLYPSKTTEEAFCWQINNGLLKEQKSNGSIR
jgi:hypothetical protein